MILGEDCENHVGRSLLTRDDLHTLLLEIEGVINARPLTYVYDDSEGIPYPLSPSQLIYGRKIASSPAEEVQEIVSTNRSLTRKAKHHKMMLDQFSGLAAPAALVSDHFTFPINKQTCC